jgi:hypothetical protein
VPEQYANVLEILISQMGQRRDVNSVLSKALRVLGHAEPSEPLRNLSHCGALSHAPCDAPVEDYPNQRF